MPRTAGPTSSGTTSLGQTILSAGYDRAEYLSHYGKSDSISADLRQTQQLSERLKGSAHVGYLNSLNPFIGNLNQPDPTVPTQPGIDPLLDGLTVGQRTRSFNADADLDWTPSAIESVSVGGNYSRSTYGRRNVGSGLPLASDYSSYGGNVSYMRAFGARTKLGLQFVANHTDSGLYGTSTSYQPNLIVQRTLSQYWSFNGSIGGIFQNAGGLINSTSHSLGFNAALCGTYPRISTCFTASRSTSSSGVGGLRSDLRFGTTFGYRINQRSRISANASYSDSKTGTGLIANVSQKFGQTGVDYTRDLNQRISIGFGGRYQWRSLALTGTAHAFSGTVNLSAQFGRTR